MNTKELNQTVGKRATFRDGDLEIAVTISDARENFGRVDFLIQPIEGAGARWVHSRNVTIDMVGAIPVPTPTPTPA